jgi:hypothetical protein
MLRGDLQMARLGSYRRPPGKRSERGQGQVRQREQVGHVVRRVFHPRDIGQALLDARPR